MVMHEQSDFIDFLCGKNADQSLILDEFQYFTPPNDRDQQLDMDNLDAIIDPCGERTYLGQITDDQCLQEVVVESEVPRETQVIITNTLEEESYLDGETSLVFRFPPDSNFAGSVTNSLDAGYMEYLTCHSNDTLTLSESTQDSDTMFSCTTVPNTPFSATLYSAPQTPDTASSWASSPSSNGGNIPKVVKESLKMAIKTKRFREGKGDLKVEFVPPPPEQLTSEEQAKREEKRINNKLAAQRCREKKRKRVDELEEEIRQIHKKNKSQENEIKKLINERDYLQDLVSVHKQVCPSFRSMSSSF